MRQFRSQTEETVNHRMHVEHRRAARQRQRLWMLVVALGLVIASMRQLGKPSTVQRLGQLFGAPENTQSEIIKQVPNQEFVFRETKASDEPEELAKPTLPLATPEEVATERHEKSLLSKIEDNTYFRSAENEVWFHFFARLQQTPLEQLLQVSLGELSYAQLLKQPHIYRGQAVTIRGTLRREEVVSAPQNDLGIEKYHRLIIQPHGGGNWPFVVYCLQIPNNFPRGEDLQEILSATGFFFKNLSYAWQDGLGLAPVVLASEVQWQPPAKISSRTPISSGGMVGAAIIAAAFAILVVWKVARSTQRSQAVSIVTLPEDLPVESIQHQLERLAEMQGQSEPDA